MNYESLSKRLLKVEVDRRLRVLQRAHVAWLHDRSNLTKKHDYDVAYTDWQHMRWAYDTMITSVS